MADRYELSDWQWHLIADIFPPPNPKGRKRSNPKKMLKAVFFVLCSGVSWRDLPEKYGPWQTAYHWWSRWHKDGTLDRILERLQIKLSQEGMINLGTWFVDATNVRATRAAAGAKGGGQALGRSRGGYGTKLHLVCDSYGNPLAALLTPGQQHESTVALDLIAGVRVRTTAGPGRPCSRPKVVIVDRGYHATSIRRYLRSRRVRCMIPEKCLAKGKRYRRKGRRPAFCAETYRKRDVVKRLVGWLKEHRRIVTRFEKLAESYLGMVKLAFIRRYFRALKRSQAELSMRPSSQPSLD